jgi:outer membrane lipoprotein-sorting protein
MTVLWLLVSIGLAIAEAGQTRALSFEALYAQSQKQQKDITSLGAQFIETTVSSLLVDPIVARGRVIAVKSGRVVMTYESPEPRTVIVDGDRLFVHWPQRGQLETLNIAEAQQRVRKYFTGASPDDLKGFFDIAVSVDGKERDAHLVDMRPRRDQIKQALERLQIWVDRDTTLMIKMRMIFPGGDSKEIRLENLRANVPVDESLFKPPARPKAR